MPKHARQVDLKDRYHFTCDCTLCARDGVDPRWAIRHAGCARGGLGSLPVSVLGKTTCECGEEFSVGKRVKTAVEQGFELLKQDETDTLGTFT